MHRFIYAAAVIALSIFSGRGAKTERTNAAFLEPLQPRDSVLIGDQMKYGFRIYDIPEGARVAVPDWKENFTEGVDLLGGWFLDTLATSRKNGTLDLEGYVVLTSFDEGLYELPPVALAVAIDEERTDTLVLGNEFLTVWEMPVDTATFVPHEIKEPVTYPITFAEVWPWVAGGIAAALLVWLLVRWILSRRKKAVEAARKEPAHIVALRKLDKYRGDKHWEAEMQKGFFSGVTDTLREYMTSRYGISAMEMTTAEIFDALQDESIPEEIYAELKTLFEETDYVKFAKHIASRESASGAVPLAVKFVTTTYQEELENEKESTSKE